MVFTIILSVGIVVTTGVLITNLSQRKLQESMEKRNLEIARRAAQEIKLYLDRSSNELRTVADILSLLHQNRLIQEIVLENLYVNLDMYQDCFLIDSNLTIVASSVFPVDMSRQDTLELDRSFFERAMIGETTFSQIQFFQENIRICYCWSSGKQSDKRTVYTGCPTFT